MSQSLWQIGRCDLNAVFFNLFFFFLSSRRVRFGSVTTLFRMKYETWLMDEHDTRQNTELKKSVVQSVLLCLSCLFMNILPSNFIKKNWEKISKAKNKKKLKAWILLNQKSNAHRKTNARGSFETYKLFYKIIKQRRWMRKSERWNKIVPCKNIVAS